MKTAIILLALSILVAAGVYQFGAGSRAEAQADAIVTEFAERMKEAEERAAVELHEAQEAEESKRRNEVLAGLRSILPCDAWPEEYKPVVVGELFGVSAYTIEWPDPTGLGTAIVATVPGQTDLRDSLAPDALQNKMTNKDLEAGQMEIKGRTVDTLRFKDMKGFIHLRVDISGEKAPYVTLELVAKAEDAGRIGEAADRFLKPFDLWREEG